jgi:hypothetical protein
MITKLGISCHSLPTSLKKWDSFSTTFAVNEDVMGGYGIYATKITMVSKERKKTDHHIAVRLLMTGPKTIYTKNEDV